MKKRVFLMKSQSELVVKCGNMVGNRIELVELTAGRVGGVSGLYSDEETAPNG